MIRTTTRALFSCLLVLSAASATEAGRAKAWQQHAYDDFAKGESEGISIAADGALELAPALVELASLEAERVWSMAPNPKGGLYVGTGDSGRLFAVDDKGQAELLFDSPELVLHALIASPDGRLYAGSAPDGLIYALDAKGQAETLLQTGSHYVWDFALVDGQLYAATGEPGQVLKVAKDGSHEVFFAPEDRHVITLLAHGDRLYAGTAGKGRIYEIDGEGRGRLLFESEQEEIHNLVAGINGEMFASAIPAPSKGENSHKVPAAVYRIGAEGAVYPIWEDTEAPVVNLVAAGEHLLLSASNPARLLHLSADGRRALVVQFESFVPSRLLFGPSGALHLGGSQKAVVSILPEKGRLKGYFESAVEDFAIHARWGALEWRGTQPADTRITVQTRTGNSEEPDKTWSTWSEPLTESGQTIASPPARFIQYRVEMESDARRGHAPAQLGRNPRRPSQPQAPHHRVANLSLPAATIRQRRPTPRRTSSWPRAAQQSAPSCEKPASSALARSRPQRGRAGLRSLSQGGGSARVEAGRRKHRANLDRLGYRIHARRPDPAQAGSLRSHG